ncbi:MAG: hypothetical protein M0P91_13215 [Sulfuricurvum sp.]|uniref:hypothetical protein n=1 Tax=Sulfuricurvum sp. TaxID=2025608 RepID=UPI0025EF7B59|nr:hypothetical protein [Sulfuricurvum sp.]MCK9374139.1 hypothetical protein [Sulfuricurvum sp.]
MTHTLINLTILAFLLLLTGCSSMNATTYATLQEMEKQKCNRILSPDERQQCIASHSQTYDQFQAQKIYH